MSDRDLRKNENEINLPAGMIGNAQLTAREIKRRREGIKSSEISQEKASKMERLTAAYWGQEACGLSLRRLFQNRQNGSCCK